jgi:hypothetical protein
MRIVIVTVYNSMNSGSYLQAYSLYQSLVNVYGNMVYFLKTGARTPGKDTLQYCVKKALRLDFKAASARKKMYYDLNQYVKKLPEIEFEDLVYEEDVFILGSDEIWNIQRDCMRDYPIFWGEGLPLNRTISYAPSINISTKEDIESQDYTIEALNKIRYLSVRDTASLTTLKSVVDRDIELVGDPTNLIEVSSFVQKLEPCTDDKYILIYIDPIKLTDERIEMIRKFADIKKLKLISFSFQNKWCDKIVNGSPYLFLSYIYHADYVLTATFHGATFSILFNKKFVAFNEKNQKVCELLSTYGLEERMIPDNALTGLEIIADAEYDAQKLNDSIALMRQKSLKYLTDHINMLMEEV